ncbi:DUF7144 family membrane protein [Nocardia sp. NBC_00416]|uniref:DUF7144 family membrane protein n=1 Tax=Nocardia sp. NBC_00416 TaxID=2975991 RepID=UPI002E1EC563
MAHSATHPPQPVRQPARQSVAAVGVMTVAAILLGVAVLGVIEGISSLHNDPYSGAPPSYSYRMTPSVWGWVHISYSILLAAVGVALIAGAAWARMATIAIAAATMVANFLWLPHAPGWATIVIVVCAVALWTVSSWHPEET